MIQSAEQLISHINSARSTKSIANFYYENQLSGRNSTFYKIRTTFDSGKIDSAPEAGILTKGELKELYRLQKQAETQALMEKQRTETTLKVQHLEYELTRARNEI